MTGRLTLIAVLVPVLGIAVLAARAEVAVRNGPVWTIPIEGYDPRDLLHGQYLEYRYRLRWQDGDTCGTTPFGPREPMAGCCLCLTRDAADGFDPWVRQVQCDEATRCEGVLHSDSLLPPQRFFVPEDRGLDLERALREHAAAIELTVSPAGEAAVRELLLDRRPWREVP